MEMNDETWYLIKSTPKVTGFLGGNTPTPLTEAEVEEILKTEKGEPAVPKPKVLFEVGENVRVIEGPFTNFTGVIDEVNIERGKLRVMVSIFGRATPLNWTSCRSRRFREAPWQKKSWHRSNSNSQPLKRIPHLLWGRRWVNTA
jgi:transcription antitermination factor NusG